MNITILEPYYGGSHKSFVDTFVKHSRHHCTVLSLPARKWKWRMRGASVWFTTETLDQLRNPTNFPDIIFCSEMLSAADLRALLPNDMRNIPIVCYFHENQLTYPLLNESDRDYQYGMTNITSCLASDAVWFNSEFHRSDFLRAATWLLKKMPDHVPNDIVATIQQRSKVLYPPVVWLADQETPSKRPSKSPLTILWCHRWEYDKNPETFFRGLIELKRTGTPFKLVITGEQFRTAPAIFSAIHDELQEHILHEGFVESHDEYANWLRSCDIVVSTAIQENFGIAVVEAMSAGCWPILPNRLAYPELIPESLHNDVLYDGDSGFTDELRQLIEAQPWLDRNREEKLQTSLRDRFEANCAVAMLDDAFDAFK